MLGSLLAPLRVPERVMEALTEAGRELGLIRSEVTRRPRANRAAGRARERRVVSQRDGARDDPRAKRAVHETLAGLQDDLQRVTEHLHGGRGPLQKVRDVLTSDDDD